MVGFPSSNYDPESKTIQMYGVIQMIMFQPHSGDGADLYLVLIK